MQFSYDIPPDSNDYHSEKDKKKKNTKLDSFHHRGRLSMKFTKDLAGTCMKPSLGPWTATTTTTTTTATTTTTTTTTMKNFNRRRSGSHMAQSAAERIVSIIYTCFVCCQDVCRLSMPLAERTAGTEELLLLLFFNPPPVWCFPRPVTPGRPVIVGTRCIIVQRQKTV